MCERRLSVSVGIGNKNCHGFPRFADDNLFPRAARSTKADSWAFASVIVFTTMTHPPNSSAYDLGTTSPPGTQRAVAHVGHPVDLLQKRASLLEADHCS